MQSTKSQILDHLKRSGGSTVDWLANTLGLARMTVRQHLAALERDGLVLSREERRRTGRPHLVFTLSDRGQEMFPKRYDRLADLALQEVAFLDADEIAGLGPQEKKRLLLSKMAERVYLQHARRVEGKTLPDRVAAVAQILDEEGGFAEWRNDGPDFEIVDYNCVYRRVADSHDDICAWHMELLARLLGSEVGCSQFQSQGAESCRFVVRLEPLHALGPVDKRKEG
ncbi:MAG TPA: winged helix-turn-helix transcriptional regulator [Dehalococcoidia bacterium]|nr:winged helix-turn-helix transcriptional regulator [Dehalococcoidia bacterium]